MIRAVIFDLDDTLIDRRAALDSFLDWQAFELFGDKPSLVARFKDRFCELDSNGRVWKDVVYSQLSREFDLGNHSSMDLLAVFEQRFAEFCQTLPFVKEMLDALKAQGLKLGLITNGRSPFQEEKLFAVGLCNSFDVVLVSASLGISKPDKAIFNLCCEQLSVTPCEALFVGDNPRDDIDGAKNAGLKTVFIPGASADYCDSADARCGNYREFGQILAQLNGGPGV